jgi:transmembrane sensor
MIRPRTPLKQWLEEPLPELQLLALWRSVQASAHGTWWATRRAQLLAAVTGLVLGSAGFMAWAPDAGAPLALRDASVLAPHSVLGDGSAHSLELSDGSQIELGASTQIEVRENNANTFALQLSAGHARFDVYSSGARRWSIESDDVSLEAIGTRFAIDRDPKGVRVVVERGMLAVSGPRVPQHAQRLAAGKQLYLANPEAPTPLAATPDAGAAPEASPALDAAVTPRRILDRATAAELSALLHEADVARESDPARALGLLERVRGSAPGSAHAALASWTLARMRMSYDPSLAAADIAIALQADLPAALREDAHAKLVEAHARAGDREQARDAASAYRRTYPNGGYMSEIERWTRAPM